MNWLVGKSEPTFWKNYVNSFSNKKNENRFVVFDCQKTGLDWRNDTIISIGCIAIVEDRIIVSDTLELFIEKTKENEPTKVNIGSLEYGKKDIVAEEEALEKFLNYISNSVLVGLNTNLDIEMLNQILKRNGLGKLKNMVIDLNILYNKSKRKPLDELSTINSLCEAFNLKPNHRQNTAGNAYLLALIFQKLKKNIKIEI
nr:exonuclease domain-containing protein [uncultured Flavobacterium sp.]